MNNVIEKTKNEPTPHRNCFDGALARLCQSPRRGPMTTVEIAKAGHVSTSYVSQLEHSGMKKLRRSILEDKAFMRELETFGYRDPFPGMLRGLRLG